MSHHNQERTMLKDELNKIRRLRLLNRLYERHNTVRDTLDARLQMHRDITDKQEDGKIMLVESGRDCDGVRYWGRTHECAADWRSVIALTDRIAYWADGPFQLAIERPSALIKSGSRDLTLEAFENGHAHCLLD
jgi:hypothetical protein